MIPVYTSSMEGGSALNDRVRYQILYHSETAQKIVGTYADGVTKEDIIHLLGGPLGGRFTDFGEGRFTYIVYMDDDE